ncbi:hypothetical protein RIF25_14690 [Thermosynechococcaceae cyanobacterium BACA0444]|uniref:Uncharacterized protein n=1 Tax=Pseudocalidococcus azoricus BACA0444 TaxID=2918990 RepID=A0AAE4K0J8_9CYAN|nr:hypothetical protein [Pseudocalidococcus azoricus]MDS3862047.1 hypothetical protein [Pseudocalidococcus azoricus BACA0444]
MANLEQIQQELTVLHDQARQGFAQLHQAYGRYLKILGPIAQQQLITAAYQVCTQIVPERFLKLEPEARERLQRKIHLLGEDLRLSLGELLPEQPVLEQSKTPTVEDQGTENSTEADENPESSPESLQTEDNQAKDITPSPKSLPEPNLEMTIAKLLHQAAHGVNRALQKVDILPEFPWEQILEIALKAQGRPLSRLPNIMMVMVAGPEDRSEDQPTARPQKSNHNPPSGGESGQLVESPSDDTEAQADAEETEKRDNIDIAAFFQALMNRRIQEADAEDEDQADEDEEDEIQFDPEDTSTSDSTLAQEVSRLQAQLNEMDVPPADDRPIPLIAIYLHLEDLDFNHPGLGSQRQQIRQLKIKLAQLQEKIAETFRQRLVLEASRAWRETWPRESLSKLPES